MGVVTGRISAELHRRAKRLLPDYGGSFQAVIERALEDLVARAEASIQSPKPITQNSEPNFSTITPTSGVVSGTLINAARELAAVAPQELIHTTAAMLRAMSGALIDEKGNSDQAGEHGPVRIEPDADAMRREVGELAAATGEGAQGDEQTG